ncbi:hypothetical protein LINPERPRIM_LOCUS14923 [Linum perenne]
MGQTRTRTRLLCGRASTIRRTRGSPEAKLG